MKTIKQSIITGLAAITIAASSAFAQQSSETTQWKLVPTGYNAAELAVHANGSTEGKSRARVFTNYGISNGKITCAISGMNQVNDANANSYFGSNKILAGNSDISATVRVITNADGITDTKLGLQTQALTKLLRASYCRADVTADNKEITGEILYGKAVSEGPMKDWTLEAFHTITAPFSGKASNYTELQVYTRQLKQLGKIQGFVRAEIPNFKTSQATYLFGAVKTF